MTPAWRRGSSKGLARLRMERASFGLSALAGAIHPLPQRLGPGGRSYPQAGLSSSSESNSGLGEGISGSSSNL